MQNITDMADMDMADIDVADMDMADMEMAELDMAELADHDIRSKSRKTNPQKAIVEQVDIVSSVHEV